MRGSSLRAARARRALERLARPGPAQRRVFSSFILVEIQIDKIKTADGVRARIPAFGEK